MKYLKHLRQRIDKNVNTQRLIVGKFNRAYHQQCGALASVRSQPCRSEFRSASTSQANVALSPNIDNQSLHDIEVPRSSRAVDAILVSKLDETLHILENKIGGPNIWVKRLEGLRDDLYAERRGRISVYGVLEAAPHEVVSSIMLDPLTDSPDVRAALVHRDKDKTTNLTISYSAVIHTSHDRLSLPAAWLRSTGFDVVEIANLNEFNMSTMMINDLTLLVVDPIRLLHAPEISANLPLLAAKGSLMLIVNGKLPSTLSPTTIVGRVRSQLRTAGVVDDIPIHVICAEEALNAYDALSTGLDPSASTSAPRSQAFTTYQSSFLQSSVGPLQADLATKLESIVPGAAGDKVLALAQRHLECVIDSDRDVIRHARHAVSELRRHALEYSTRAKHLSVVNRSLEGGLLEGGVQSEIQQVKREVEDLFSTRLSWLSLLGRLRIDDVSPELCTRTSVFGTSLEKQIIFETGQLSQMQGQLTIESDNLVRRLALEPARSRTLGLHPFSSPLLVNRLSTLSLAIPQLVPESLLQPLYDRRKQLSNTSVARLHWSAQKAMLLTYCTSAIGILFSWGGSVGPLVLVSEGTALGLGLLSVLGSLAVGQRMWHAAQKRFWRDFDRVTRMLEGELKQTFVSAIESHVTAKPVTTADSLEVLIAKRETELNGIQTTIDRLKPREIPA